MGKALPPVALIAGPTASGKSSLALVLAERTGGVIINADSAQIYRDLDVLSARPSAPALARAEHRLYGVRDGAEPCSAAEWASFAREEITQAHTAGRLPIVVGGTGLYLRTLLDGIAPIPPIDPTIRAEIRTAPIEINRAALEALDSRGASRLRPNDTARISRALEVIRSTGRPISAWQSERRGGIGRSVALKPLILLPPREWLYGRCDARFAGMLDGCASHEVAALLQRQLDPHLPVMHAIGVREIAAMLRGDASRDQTLAAGALATRRYAKRQYTWFAHQPPAGWPRFVDVLDDDGIGAALALLDPSD
ncbi:MAG: tRNA (adenosine(37)-N6)-dimethylallyltransferase MiaA [Sphingomicrobium sp.]|nr:tRNA (adenosine(37)-N6)-dimethylallyltransferase MiaA [Sphingomonadales bacterium]